MDQNNSHWPFKTNEPNFEFELILWKLETLHVKVLMPILGFGTTRIHVLHVLWFLLLIYFVTTTVYTLRFVGFLSRSRRYIIVCKNCNLYALLHTPSPQVVANCLKALCVKNHEKSIPSVSRGLTTIAIGVHPSRSQICKNFSLRLSTTGLNSGLKMGPIS